VFLRHGIIKLGDFGIARVLLGTMDEANTFAGTPYYMSPEALQGWFERAAPANCALPTTRWPHPLAHLAFSGTRRRLQCEKRYLEPGLHFI
jgi:hypothetical protein